MRGARALPLLLILVCLIPLVPIGWFAYPHIVLSIRGVHGTGVITRLHVDAVKRGSIYAVDYRFGLPTKTIRLDSYSATGTVTAAAYGRLAVGQNVPIIYDPQKPDRSELVIDDPADRSSFFTASAVLLLVSVLLLIVAISASLRTFFKERWLLRWGRPAEATILCTRPYVYARGSVRTAVAYGFSDNSNQRRQDECLGFPRDLKQGDFPEVFSNPTVLFDPRDSQRNVLYGKLAFTCLPSRRKKPALR